MTQDFLRAALLSTRAPRYTSYPPANRFDPRVGPDEKAAWLRRIPSGEAISLYVHVPFCRRLCWFCACRTQGCRTDAPLDRYLDHLAREVELTAEPLRRRPRLSALHLGGGTPTLLSPERIDRLVGILASEFDWDVRSDVSVEIDPCEFDAARLAALMRLGLTRASLGVQDFDPLVQEAIGRRQSVEVTAGAVAALRRAGVTEINIDLLYGLPFQSRARFSRTLDRVIALGPDRIALFGYAHVPWLARRQRMIPEHALPSPEARLDLAEHARARFLAAGYVPIGIDHFAQPGDTLTRAAAEGRLRRNFQGYTTDTAATLLGFGPSAISRHRKGFAQNAAATDAWQTALGSGQLPTARGVILTEARALTGQAIEALMCYGRLPLRGLNAAFRPAADRAAALYPDVARVSGHVLELTDMRAARLVARLLDGEAEDEPEGRYSQAS